MSLPSTIQKNSPPGYGRVLMRRPKKASEPMLPFTKSRYAGNMTLAALRIELEATASPAAHAIRKYCPGASERTLFAILKRVALAVGAQVDRAAQVLHRLEVLDPEHVECLQHIWCAPRQKGSRPQLLFFFSSSARASSLARASS
jgi:hypothetical protein